jgi:hypothetical protein
VYAPGLHFRWPVAPAYDWHWRPARSGSILTTHPAGWELHAQAGARHWREPLNEASDLFRQFAGLWGEADEAVRAFVNDWGLPDEGDVADLRRVRDQVNRITFLQGALDDCGAVMARKLLAAEYRPRVRRSFNAAEGPPAVDLPATLYGAMLSQIAETGWNRCVQCGELFQIGDPEAKRRGLHTRRHSRFCSIRCKDRWNAVRRAARNS